VPVRRVPAPEDEQAPSSSPLLLDDGARRLAEAEGALVAAEDGMLKALDPCG